MSNFAFRKVGAIKPKEQVLQLVIGKEGQHFDEKAQLFDAAGQIIEKTGQLDIFEEETKSQYSRQYSRILYVLELAASGTLLPKEKFRVYNAPSSITLRVYECKAGDLRLYVAQMKSGKVIVLGGMKNRQKADFRQLNSLLKRLQKLENDL